MIACTTSSASDSMMILLRSAEWIQDRASRMASASASATGKAPWIGMHSTAIIDWEGPLRIHASPVWLSFGLTDASVFSLSQPGEGGIQILLAMCYVRGLKRSAISCASCHWRSTWLDVKTVATEVDFPCQRTSFLCFQKAQQIIANNSPWFKSEHWRPAFSKFLIDGETGVWIGMPKVDQHSWAKVHSQRIWTSVSLAYWHTPHDWSTAMCLSVSLTFVGRHCVNTRHRNSATLGGTLSFQILLQSWCSSKSSFMKSWTCSLWYAPLTS